jgi:TonB-linked SusC/RagA family outer membrane protein
MVATAAAAQQSGTITGRVLTESGGPLSAVSVTITSLGLGAYTNDLGVYTLAVPGARMTGQTVTMTARRVGYAPKSTTIKLNSGSNVQQDFSLIANATNLSSVVVTALGVEKPKSELGTSVQQVSTEELNATHDNNVLNQLSGKVSGVNITSSGTQGGSTKITIRGANSITGNNDPLFIVDGTPVSNRARGGSPNGGMTSGIDFGSVINDINPDDIATVTVLKGPNAAAIYGSRGANGVILITTKRGSASSDGIQTSITSNYTWDTPSIIPEFQNLYGQGSGGQFQFFDGVGGGVQDFNDQSFGPRLDGRTMGCIFKPGTSTTDPFALTSADYDQTQPCTQFTSPVVNGVLQPMPWIAHPDNVKDFFQTGSTFSNNIAFSGGTQRATGRLSVGVDNSTGVIPNNTFRKFSSSLAANFNVSSRLNTSATIQYVSNKAYNRAGVGYGTGILEGMYVWFGRQVDINALKDYHTRPDQTFACNGQYNWNCNFHNNPYWIQYENPEADNRDHVIGNAQATWTVTDWLNATARTGSDFYHYNQDQNFGAGNLAFGTDLAYQGGFTHFQNRSNENNSSVSLAANKKANSWLQLNGTLGANRRYATYNSGSVQTDAILAAGIYNVSNSAKPTTDAENIQRRQTNSLYGSGMFTVNGLWTVEVTGRNDWSSTLPKENNSYFYPSVNTSLVLTDLMPALKSTFLSYAKLRGSLANVGNDADPYQLVTTYEGNPDKFGGLPQYTLPNARLNPSLKPENTNSAEVGLELGFFNNRATLDATYYSKATTNEIVQLSLASATGFSTAWLNAGKLTNKGFEALVTVIPIQTASGFQWTSTFNFAKNSSKLVSLYPGVENYRIGSTWTIDEEARVGQPYGDIFATGYKRDPATGELLLTNDGLPQSDAGHPRVLGNVNPDWTGGWNNEIRWGRFTASALLDIHQGGDIYSVTNMFGEYTGVLKSTTKGREVDWNDPGLVVKGINQGTGEENTVVTTSELYYQSLFQNGEAYLYDDSFVKLRELRIGYDLPSSFTRKLRVNSANIAFVGRNLWTHSNVPNIDPEFAYTTGNYQGAEFAALPTTRSLGFNLRITP